MSMIDGDMLIMAIEKWQTTLMPGWSSANDTDTVIYNTLEEMIGLVESQPPADQWIPCSERLPNNYNDCLVTVKPSFGCVEYVMIANFDPLESEEWHYEDHDGGYHRIGNVTAWMPLPEPYRGE